MNKLIGIKIIGTYSGIEHLLLGMVLWFCWLPIPLKGQSPDADIFPIPSGVLSRTLNQAKESLAKEDYPNAVASLSKILQSPDSPAAADDYFLPTLRKYSTKSIRREAVKLIGEMPARGRAFYELKFGIAARKKLAKAIEADDFHELTEVANRYFHTKASYVAVMLLAKEKLFNGDFQFAYRYLNRLMDSPQAKQLLEPELTILSAITLARIGKPGEAGQVVYSLKKDFPIINFRFGNNVVSHTISDADSAQQWIAELTKVDTVPEFQSEKSLFESEWLEYRSDERLSKSLIGPPLPIAEWQVPVPYPSDRNRLVELQQQLSDNQISVIPCMNSVALKNTVVMRTPQNVVAVDIKSGKRIWLYPWDDKLAGQVTAQSDQAMDKKLKMDYWSNHAAGRIVADGEKVYFVESANQPVLDQRQSQFPEAKLVPTSSNALVALRVIDERGVSVEGQLAWKIDGNSTDSDLKGCVFLGPPFVKDDVAYVIIELAGQIRLLAIDSQDGNLIWSQQLASTQSRDGHDERLFRHRNVATPVFHNGLLICPTLVGGLVAVDLSDRTLKWGGRYESRRYLGTRYGQPARSWHDNAMFFIDNYLIFSPVESNFYYCITPENGRRKFIKPKGDLLFLAGRYNSSLVAVSPANIELIAVSGYSSHKIDISQFGPVVGLGVFSREFYYLPTGKGLVKVDLANKKVDRVYVTGNPLGNLMTFQGRLLSHSTQHLASYYQKPFAEKLVQQTQSKVSPDPSLSLIESQLFAAAGKTQEAIDAAIRSIEITGTDESREFLASLLVKKIKENQKLNWKKIDRAASLVQHPRHQRKLLLARIDSFFRNGKGDEAIEDVFRLVDIYAKGISRETELISTSHSHTITEIRLVRSRIKSAFEILGKAEQQAFKEKLEQTYKSGLNSANPDQARVLAELFGEFDFVETYFSLLASRLVHSENSQDILWTEAFLLDQLDQSKNRSERLETLKWLGSIYEHQFGNSTSSYFDQRISCLELQKKLMLEGLADQPQLNIQLQEVIGKLEILQGLSRTRPEPHDGMAKVSLKSAERDAELFIDISGRKLASQRVFSRALKSSKYSVEANDSGDFVIRDLHGRKLYQNSVRKRGGKHLNLHYESTHYQVLGNLMVISFGYDHVGLDLTKINDLQKGMSPFAEFDDLEEWVGEQIEDYDVPVLWRFNSFEPLGGVDRQLSRLIREANSLNVVVERKVDFSGNRIGRTSWVTRRGICLLNKSSLICLDPWSGSLLWKRTDIAPNSDLLGDLEHVFIISPDDKSFTTYRMMDGNIVAKPDLPPELINRILTNGPNVVSVREEDNRTLLFGYRLKNNKAEKSWSRALAVESKAYKVNELELAILEPNGQFEVIQIDSGKSILKQVLKIGQPFSTIQVFSRGERYLLFVNQNNQNVIEAKRVDLIGKPKQQINIRGELHYLDRSGPRWQNPVLLDGFDFVLNQPEEIPVWLFRREDRLSRSTEIVFIRESDGSAIKFSKPIGKISGTSSVRFNPEENRVSFNFGYRLLHLDLTDHPRPVEPPARTGKFATRPDAFRKQAGEKAKQIIKDLFLEDDSETSSLNLLKNWVEAEWRRNPLNPQSQRIQRK